MQTTEMKVDAEQKTKRKRRERHTEGNEEIRNRRETQLNQV